MSKNTSRAQYMREYRSEKKQNTTEATLLLAEITRSYKANRKLIEEAMKDLNKGTNTYLAHINALAKLDAAHREELVERGLSPANLAAATAPGWRFVCTITGRGDTSVVEIKPGGTAPVSASLGVHGECPECRARVIAELEEEFPADTPTVRKEEE